MSTPDAIDIAIRNVERALMRKRLSDALLDPCRTLMRAAGPVATTCSVCRPGDPCWFCRPFVSCAEHMQGVIQHGTEE